MTNTNPSYSNYFRRPRISGRACSPPTFACYEQRFNPYDDDDDYSDDGSEDNVSCSEDGEDYGGSGGPRHESDSDNEDSDHPESPVENGASQDVDSMDIDEGEDSAAAIKVAAHKIDVKGKQRAIEPEPESPKRQHRQRKPRQPVYTLRPILTIQRSQGFVWNQVSNLRLLYAR